MYSLKEPCSAILEVKQSKFIAHLVPYDMYEQKLAFLKEEHPKARHFVTAYRYLNEFGQIVESSSDDGEPKGTSGKPSLMVLQGHELINTAVIVVRYFGGTKLGTGGLVRAYSDAVNLVLKEAVLDEYKEQEGICFTCAYSDIRLVEYAIAEEDLKIVHKEFDTQAHYKLRAPKESIESFIKRLSRVITLQQ